MRVGCVYDLLCGDLVWVGSMNATCPRCHGMCTITIAVDTGTPGTGYFKEVLCDECNGEGEVEVRCACCENPVDKHGYCASCEEPARIEEKPLGDGWNRWAA